MKSKHGIYRYILKRLLTLTIFVSKIKRHKQFDLKRRLKHAKLITQSQTHAVTTMCVETPFSCFPIIKS